MNQLLDAAIGYAHRGWRVFPLYGITAGACACGNEGCSSPGKHPHVKHGLHAATTDMDQIRRWWRLWPNANVGIATGRESAIVVIDIDPPAGNQSLDTLTQSDRALPLTMTVRTGSGGSHLYFCHPGHSLPNTTARIPGFDEPLPGIDMRADSGYVVAPPSAHISGGKYLFDNPNVEQADLPDWIVEPERTPLPRKSLGPADYTGNGSAYGLAVLEGELMQLRAAGPGTRNHALNRSAFAVGQVVAGGELDEIHARAGLLSTGIAIGLSEPEVRQTLESGFTAGTREPRSAPHRPPRPQ